MSNPIPKKLKDSFSDEMNRAESKALYKKNKDKSQKDQAMQDLMKQPGGREALMDFITGKTTVNPLAPIKEPKKAPKEK